MWIDTHCHLDAPEFGVDHALTRTLRQRAAGLGVGLCVIPAVERANFDTVRQLAHQLGDAYALGIHPLFVPQAQEADVQALDAALSQHRDDPRLVAVGEIGLDFFVPALTEPAMRERQTRFYRAQLRLARKHGLPVILHVRRSADALLVSLKKDPVFSLTIPGKVQAYLASGKPILGMINGEAAHVIEASGAGLACPSGDATALARITLELATTDQNKRIRMGNSGREYYLANYSKPTLLASLEQLFRDATLRKGRICGKEFCVPTTSRLAMQKPAWNA